MNSETSDKIKMLKEKLAIYEAKLAQAMIGYGGVKHESAASEIKHDKVMVLRDFVGNLKVEIANLEKKLRENKY